MRLQYHGSSRVSGVYMGYCVYIQCISVGISSCEYSKYEEEYNMEDVDTETALKVAGITVAAVYWIYTIRLIEIKDLM